MHKNCMEHKSIVPVPRHIRLLWKPQFFYGFHIIKSLYKTAVHTWKSSYYKSSQNFIRCMQRSACALWSCTHSVIQKGSFVWLSPSISLSPSVIRVLCISAHIQYYVHWNPISCLKFSSPLYASNYHSHVYLTLYYGSQSESSQSIICHMVHLS